MGYTFRAMMRDDLAMAQRWLETPEVRLWWGDPDGEAGLLEGGLDEPATTMWIVSFEGRPFAYVQDYDPHAWPMHHLGDMPPGSRGVDRSSASPP